MELFNKTYVLIFIANSTKIHYYKMEFKVKIQIQISFGNKLILIPSMWNFPAWNLHKLEEHAITGINYNELQKSNLKIEYWKHCITVDWIFRIWNFF